MLRRDIISNGYDQAIEILCQQFPLTVHQYPTGLRCWTWRIPDKWTCEEAYIETLGGKRIIDQQDHPLYVASYSVNVDQVMTRAELLSHLHLHPHLEDQPPFIFYYYQPQWGFCCGKNVLDTLTDEKYRVVIRSRFESGTLKVGEYYLPGDSDDCFVLGSHLCHPCQVNDGLSGVVTALAVMQELAAYPRRRYSYRLLITPETIGSIAWLSHNEDLIPQLKGGLFLDMTGLRQPPALQMSYFGNTQVDICLKHVHMRSENGAWWAPYRGVVGNDERQFNAPGVRIPMLSYSRALPWGHPHRPYKEYHSAADDLDITSDEMLEKSKSTILAMIEAWEGNYYPCNLFKGEVFLSGYNLAVDRHKDLDLHRNKLRVMDYIDGTNSIVDIADKLDLPFSEVKQFVDDLESVGLIEVCYNTSDSTPLKRGEQINLNKKVFSSIGKG